MSDNKSQINQQEKRDLDLMRKHLNKLMIKSKKAKDIESAEKLTKKMMIDHKENLWGKNGLAHWLGSKDLEYFCLYFLQDIYIPTDEEIKLKKKAPLSKTHIEIWHELEEMVLNTRYNQRNYICPRSFGKTSCISTPVALWCSAYKFKQYIVIASAVDDTASAFLKNIGNALTKNERIEKAFGKLTDKKTLTFNSSEIQLTNGVKIQAISASSATRGKNDNFSRIDCLIMDDFQSDVEVGTPEARDKKWKLYNDSLKNATQANTSLLLSVGTIQHKECFYSRILNSPSWKSVIKKCVLLDDIDDYFHSDLWEEFYKIFMNRKDEDSLIHAKEFYFNHEKEMQYPLLWGEFWSCVDIAIKYYENPVSFKQEYQNDIASLGEKKFKSVATEDNEEIEAHSFEKTILVCDPANTRTKTSKKDYFAFALISTCNTNKYKYVRKGEIYKFTKNREYEDYIEHVIYLLKEYKDITHLCIEKNTYGGADSLRIQELINEDKELKSRRIEIISYYQNSNKDDKINTIVGAVNLGQIIFNEDDIEAIEQLKEFTTCKLVAHDDFPDIVAQGSKMIDEIEVIRELRVLDISSLGF